MLPGSTRHPVPVVLVVEDEPLLRMMAVDLVEEAGFVAIEAANGDAAMVILESRADIRAIFTDVDMPGRLDGLRLAAFACERWPPLEVIVTSGKARRDPIELPRRGVFLAKPYDPARLTALLRELLGAA